ncbi:hypothetical protein T11_12774 [Trichinella zimbabwensis]|uniref:Uncharacterized protein n=1 Tax=Trichinella zimbabwensis TaxID=268475 RepID=A0A0V1GVC9_9BILA|nr:hypothetical protein T11_12774 [Trichinella zimbabwensis]
MAEEGAKQMLVLRALRSEIMQSLNTARMRAYEVYGHHVSRQLHLRYGLRSSGLTGPYESVRRVTVGDSVRAERRMMRVDFQLDGHSD